MRLLNEVRIVSFESVEDPGQDEKTWETPNHAPNSLPRFCSRLNFLSRNLQTLFHFIFQAIGIPSAMADRSGCCNGSGNKQRREVKITGTQSVCSVSQKTLKTTPETVKLGVLDHVSAPLLVSKLQLLISFLCSLIKPPISTSKLFKSLPIQYNTPALSRLTAIN